MMSNVRMRTYVPLIQRFVARIFLYHTAVAEQLGLHGTDLKALQLLGHESMSPGALGEQVGLTGAAITALIDRLEQAGYVVRERDTEDRRRLTVHAIPAKLRTANRLYATQNARMSKLLSKYSADEFLAINDFLAQATHMLTEEVEELRNKPK